MKRSRIAVKNKNAILMAAAGLIALFLVFAWLFWGSTVPEPTDKTKKTETETTKATVYNTVLHRDEGGKRLWELKVGEAIQLNDNLVRAKQLEGTVYLDNGDEMFVTADAAEVKIKTNEFTLTNGVTARLKQGGFLKADKVEWDRNKDILTATGAVKVIKEDMMATAEKVITSSKLEHFKLKDKAHVERGGTYEEK
jgi:LPS export ABC transporter protein LptC